MFCGSVTQQVQLGHVGERKGRQRLAGNSNGAASGWLLNSGWVVIFLSASPVFSSLSLTKWQYLRKSWGGVLSVQAECAEVVCGPCHFMGPE